MPDAAHSPKAIEDHVFFSIDALTHGLATGVKVEALRAIQRRLEAELNALDEPAAHLKAMVVDLRKSSTDYSAALDILILKFLGIKRPMNDLLNHLHSVGIHVLEKGKGNKSVPKDASPAERLRPTINTRVNRMFSDRLIMIDSSAGARQRVLWNLDLGDARLNRLLLNPSQAQRAYLSAAGIIPKPDAPQPPARGGKKPKAGAV